MELEDAVAIVSSRSGSGAPAEYATLVESMVTNAYLDEKTVRLDAGLRLAPK